MMQSLASRCSRGQFEVLQLEQDVRSCPSLNLCPNSMSSSPSVKLQTSQTTAHSHPVPWTRSLLLSEDAQVPIIRKGKQRNEVWSEVWQGWRLLCPPYTCGSCCSAWSWPTVLSAPLHPNLTDHSGSAWPEFSAIAIWELLLLLCWWSMVSGRSGWATEKRIRK